MVKALWTLCKTAAFALVVLLLGVWIRWDGRTLSDHVGKVADSIERSGLNRRLRTTATELVEDAEDGIKRSLVSKAGSAVKDDGGEFLPSERAKLRKLIDELNQ